MSFAQTKAIFALVLATILFGAASIFYRRRRTAATALAALATAFFVVVALTHLCEAFGLLSAFAWGEHNSLGHYIDLGAALLGLLFALSALATASIKRHRR